MENKPKLTLGQAIQVLALQSIEEPTDESTYREVCRWYSKTFSTPLHVVEADLDPLVVLTHFYETVLKDMKEEADRGDEKAKASYEKYKDSILNPGTDEEEENEDDAWAAELLKEIREQEAKNQNKTPPLNLNINQLKLTEEDRKALAEDVAKEFKKSVSGEEEPT